VCVKKSGRRVRRWLGLEKKLQTIKDRRHRFWLGHVEETIRRALHLGSRRRKKTIYRIWKIPNRLLRRWFHKMKNKYQRKRRGEDI